jgi:hypothetical protein
MEGVRRGDRKREPRQQLQIAFNRVLARNSFSDLIRRMKDKE